MTEEELDAAVERLIKRTRIDRGLPYHIEDPEVLAAVDRIVAPALRRIAERSEADRSDRPGWSRPSDPRGVQGNL